MKAGSAIWQLPPSESVPSNWLSSSGATSAYIAERQQQHARTRRRRSDRLTREERRRTALIRGLRFYLTKAGKKAYFCYRRCKTTNYIFCVFCSAGDRAMELLTRLMADPKVAAVFNRQQLVLNHSLPLSCYLLKPVQRILKYQLLLQVYYTVILLLLCYICVFSICVSLMSQDPANFYFISSASSLVSSWFISCYIFQIVTVCLIPHTPAIH